MTIRWITAVAMVSSFSLLTSCGKKRERVVEYENGPPVRYDDDDDDDYDDDDFDYDDDDYENVVIEHRHVCSEYGCPNHYYNGNRVVVLRSHRHRPGCGHVWNGRYWVRGPRRVVRSRHVCAQGRCYDHYWNGSRIVRIAGHRHGPGCGHVWNGTYWIVGRGPVASPRARRGGLPARHICTRGGCHDHFWNGSRIVRIAGHRHSPGCGHFWDGKHWIAGRGVAPGPRGGRRVIRRR